MSKKDYERIAAVIRTVTEMNDSVYFVPVAMARLANDLANGFEHDNPRFDRSKFLDWAIPTNSYRSLAGTVRMGSQPDG